MASCKTTSTISSSRSKGAGKVRPYLIYTHDYRRNSAGIRALHRLCHHLNQYGQEAWVTSAVTNPAWDVRVADPSQYKELARDGIVVYPEVEDLNPLGARRVVRYILNTPGLIRHARFGPDERQYLYCDLLRQCVDSGEQILSVPVVDTNVFHPPKVGQTRFEPPVVWYGKEGAAPRLPATESRNTIKITLDWPESWDVLADLFRTSVCFFTHTAYSALTIEARLCGCPVVVIPSGRFSRSWFERYTPAGMNGLAWGLSQKELDHARETVDRFLWDYECFECDFDQQIYAFIRDTQNWEL
jgi:hypothetical protein